MGKTYRTQPGLPWRSNKPEFLSLSMVSMLDGELLGGAAVKCLPTSPSSLRQMPAAATPPQPNPVVTVKKSPSCPGIGGGPPSPHENHRNMLKTLCGLCVHPSAGHWLAGGGQWVKQGDAWMGAYTVHQRAQAERKCLLSLFLFGG